MLCVLLLLPDGTAVDTTAAVPQFLAGLSPASASATAAAAAAAAVLLLLVLLLLSSMHISKVCCVRCADLCCAWIFHDSHVSHPEPYRFLYMP